MQVMSIIWFQPRTQKNQVLQNLFVSEVYKMRFIFKHRDRRHPERLYSFGNRMLCKYLKLFFVKCSYQKIYILSKYLLELKTYVIHLYADFYTRRTWRGSLGSYSVLDKILGTPCACANSSSCRQMRGSKWNRD